MVSVYLCSNLTTLTKLVNLTSMPSTLSDSLEMTWAIELAYPEVLLGDKLLTLTADLLRDRLS